MEHECNENMDTKRKEISSDIRNLVIECHLEGHSRYKLAEMFNIPRSTIQSIIKKYKRHGIVENRTGRGRKCLFT